MKIKVLLLLSVLLFPLAVLAQWRDDRSYEALYDSERVTSFKQQVGYLSSYQLEGRAPGSEGEKEAAVYVYQKLLEAGVEMMCPQEGEVFGIASESGDTLVSRNVVGAVMGYDKNLKNRYIVVGARLDNLGVNQMTVDGVKTRQVYYGANGNASGLAMMTELAKMVSTNAILFRRTVIFVAFGASGAGYAGSWYFLNRSFPDADKIDAMINLDMVGTGSNGFYAFTSSNADMNTIVRNLAMELQPITPTLTTQEPYPSDHRAFYAAEIPSVLLTTGRYPEHNSYKDVSSIIDYDTMEKELEYAYNLTLATANGSAPAFRPGEVPKRGPSYDDVVSVNDCDTRPMFYNSYDPRQFLQKWVYEYVKYPAAAVEQGIQGTVIVDFVIEKNGEVKDVRVIKSVHPLLDDEAVRVIAASPKWKPGKIGKNKVRTQMSIPVEFRLARRGSKGNFGIKK